VALLILDHLQNTLRFKPRSVLQACIEPDCVIARPLWWQQGNPAHLAEGHALAAD
jgi:hypothetical protein